MAWHSPPRPEIRRSPMAFMVGDDRFRATLIGVAEGSELRIILPPQGSHGHLPTKGLWGSDDFSPEYRRHIGIGTGRHLVTINQVCEAKLYRRDGLVHELGLKGHGERGITVERRWRAQWGKLEGNCNGKPFKYEIGANSIEKDGSRMTLRDVNSELISDP